MLPSLSALNLPSKLVLASHNPGKLKEIQDLLSPLGLEVLAASQFGEEELEETGTTFHANAEIKARYYAELSGLPALADDSGLTVEALNGQPGIYSARWAGPEKDFRLAMGRVLEELAPLENRRAAFVCVLSLVSPDGNTSFFQGQVKGTIAPQPRGTNGFGYDPIFMPAGETRTFGQMESHEKKALSHRSKAFSAFMKAHLRHG